MPDDTTNADRERNSKSNVVSLTGRRDADGTLTGVECHVEYFEACNPEPEEWDFQRVVSADIEYSVEDGVARLCSVSDRDAEGAVEPGLLRVLPAGEAAVASVPGVERTERIEDTLGAVIEAGRQTVSADE